MNNRVEVLLKKLMEKEMDAMIIYGEMNRRYLSGFTGSSGILYISKSKQIIITDFRYIEQASKQCVGYEVVNQGNVGAIKTLHQIILEDGVKRIGFESSGVTYCQFNELKEELVEVQLIATIDLVEDIRMIKDENELALIKKAAQIADSAFEHILPFLKIGISEIDVALELEFFMKKNGAEKLSFDTIVASGKNSSLPHAHPTNKKLQKGDFLTMDFGCVYEGYCSDMTRTVVLGTVREEQKLIYNTVLNAQLEALAVLKAGPTGQEVDGVARDIIDGAGYAENFGHGLGHSLGLEVHENPRLSLKGTVRLLPNMMMTVEPGIYIPNFGGVRIEDLVCITENGYVNFTHSKKDLIEL